MNKLVDYDGSDLILLVGAPGSKWSAAYRYLSTSPDINSTDKAYHREFNHPFTTDLKQIRHSTLIAQHQGAYWGPGNEFGDKFSFLHNCSKQYIYNEFKKAFENFDGRKIIKSHAFAYNLHYLSCMFPKATFVLCYRNDIDCFSWWHACGGWGINYPNYTWYENDTRMLDKIKEENYNILKFATDHNKSFERYTVGQLCDALDISRENVKDIDDTLKFKVAITKGIRPAHIHSL